MPAEVPRAGWLCGARGHYSYLQFMYNRGIYKGEAALPDLMNDRYPWIRPSTVEEFFGSAQR